MLILKKTSGKKEKGRNERYLLFLENTLNLLR